ncbi:hypothetical protein MM817_03003 [Acidibacillus sp. S0AB]|uniref:Uncharacterized protein n=1 Tax=Sulfoacidibacillus ferrooxidans TaxID=2005001 RepID=A0A9X2AG28_9BACL|nr:hypothetical protein [Sulfoacidibacillus ferrooxidans]
MVMYILKNKRRSLIGVLTLGIGLVLTGCGTTSATPLTSQVSSANDKPTPGGTIIYALAPQTNINWYLPLINGASDTTVKFSTISISGRRYRWGLIINQLLQISITGMHLQQMDRFLPFRALRITMLI